MSRAITGLASWIVVAVIVVMVGRSGNLVLIGVGTLTAIWATWSSSLNLIWGFVGDFSMAQVGIGAVSAYTESILIQQYSWSFWTAFLAALAAALVTGLVIGVVASRLSGLYFSVMTLAFGLAVVYLALTLPIAGQTTGIAATLPTGSLKVASISWTLSSRNGGFLILSWICLAIVLAVMILIRKGTLGRAMVAVREDIHLSESVGIDVKRTRLLAFVIAAVIAGLAGTLYADYFGFVLPTVFEFSALITMILQVVIGGRGYIAGPVLGAAIYVVLADWVRLGGNYSDGVFGLVLVFIIIVAPKGILGLGHDAIASVGQRRLRSAEMVVEKEAEQGAGETIVTISPASRADTAAGTIDVKRGTPDEYKS